MDFNGMGYWMIFGPVFGTVLLVALGSMAYVAWLLASWLWSLL